MTAHPLQARLTAEQDALPAMLRQHRFWQLVRNDQEVGLFDAQTGQTYPLLATFQQVLDAHPFLWIHQQTDDARVALWDKGNALLWVKTDHERTGKDAGSRLCAEGRWGGLGGWRLPTVEELTRFVQTAGNPWRQGDHYRLHLRSTALTLLGGFWLDSDFGKFGSDLDGYLYPCHPHWQKLAPAERLADLVARGWLLKNTSNKPLFTPKASPSRPLESWLGEWHEQGITLRTPDGQTVIGPEALTPAGRLIDIDYRPCRLPRLDRSQLHDPAKGLWELWGADAAWLEQHRLIARDPAHDLRSQAVAIDFGTSSTVVAVETDTGGRRLLRVGARDFFAQTLPEHYENPTVLEVLDFSAFFAKWTSTAYRPPLDWEEMRAAHEAQASWRDNPGDSRVLARILPRLKQWALRNAQQQPILTDARGHSFRLTPHQPRYAVRGKPLAVGPDDPFDPIELYAWYLGMAINWRGHGLYRKYYLTFPVKYPKEVRSRILDSFQRGLQRSLPPTLLDHHREILNDFEVRELATEPAAYAAAALAELGIEPSEAGIPYAVFDFGGGTTDIDFGLYRWATEAEENAGYERVIEHIAESGDEFLGGENLLEHLVYHSFQHNLELLRQRRIPFTQPIDAKPFAGSESLLAETLAARTNTLLLAAKLRPFLEAEQPKLDARLTLDLFDADGQKQSLELKLDAQALDEWLLQRIRRGVELFLCELRQHALPHYPKGETIHLLLAGNGSRNRHLKTLLQGAEWDGLRSQFLGEEAPAIEVHLPLPIRRDAPEAPTAKTGVALGLLALTPGANFLFLRRPAATSDNAATHADEAPFGRFVGRIRRGVFQPVLEPGSAYGAWHELGPLTDGTFRLFYTASQRARYELREQDPELRFERIECKAAPTGAKLFVRAVKPRVIELAAASDATQIETAAVQRMALG